MMLIFNPVVFKRQGSLKMKSPRIILLLALLSLSAPVWAGPMQPSCVQHPDIRNLMSVSEYTRSGLDKLTKQQVDALNAWLAKYTQSICPTTTKPEMAPSRTTSTPTSSAGNFGEPPKEVSTTDRIVSHIAGEFHGWTGQTKFRLSNGQVWVQAGPGYYETDIKNPKVVIKKLLIGYILQVNGKEVFVRRIH